MSSLRDQLRDKDQVLEFVEAEVSKIKERQEADSREMEAKDDMLAEMRVLNEELRRNIATKTDEIKLLIDRMETFKKQKEAEVAKVVGRQKQTENDMRLLIQEHERQKQVAQERIKTLSELFIK